MDLAPYITSQLIWSRRTFGDGRRTEGICKHIEKELQEIRQDPTDIMEWVDVIILALDGAWRHGHSPEAIASALEAKQRINFGRDWPTPGPEDQPIEHVRK